MKIPFQISWLVSLAVAFAATTALAGIPAEIVLGTPRMGEVLFSHPVHRGVGVCADCHHKGVESGGCRKCHGVDPAIPNMKIASHAMCKDCHKKKGAPTGCRECHIRKATDPKAKPAPRNTKPPVRIMGR